MTKDVYFSKGECWPGDRHPGPPNAKNYDSYCGCCEDNKNELNVAGKGICADNCPSDFAAHFSNGGCRKGFLPNAKNYDSYCGCCEDNKNELNVAGKGICADNCPSGLASMAMASANYCGAGGEATNNCLYKDGTGECEMMGCGLSDPNLSLIGNICQGGALNSDPNYCKGVSGCKMVSDPIKNACGGSVGSSHACVGKTYPANATGLGHSVTCCDDAQYSGDNIACGGAVMDNAFCEQQADNMPVCHPETSAHHQRKHSGNFGGQGQGAQPQPPLGPGGKPPVNVNTLSAWNTGLGIASILVGVILVVVFLEKRSVAAAIFALLLFVGMGVVFLMNIIKIKENYGNLPAQCQDSDCVSKCGSGAKCRPGACRMTTGNNCCVKEDGSACSSLSCFDPGVCSPCEDANPQACTANSDCPGGYCKT